jgi:gliding motility-associated-like protein
MNAIKNILFLVFYCYSTVAAAQYINVDDNQTAQQLVKDVLVKSTCANVLNINGSGNNAVPVQNSFAYFNSGGSNFPFAEGVLLSTSASKNAKGPYVPENGGGGDLWLGDADLDQTLGIKSINATVLEFDFVPLTQYISFNYIFASNEYQNIYPCNFSDGFAFLIKENIPGSSYQNLAVLPGTSPPVPVSSKNVHPAISPLSTPTFPINGCPAVNESYFQGFNTGTSPINYAGQTKIMNAQATVTVGKPYHIKLVIADDRYALYDSAIFLEAGSFTAKIDLGPDRSPSTNNPLCFGENLIIDTKLPTDLGYTFKWYKDGSPTPISGETNPSYKVTAPGTYRVEVELGSSACPAFDEIKIEYAPEIILKNTSLIQCDDDNDGITVFDLTKADAIVKNNNPNISTLEYYESQIDAQGKINPIINPTTYKNIVPVSQTVFARVVNTLGCVNYAQIQLVVSNNSIAPQNPIESCDIDAIQDGLTQFNLNTQITPQVINGLTPGLTPGLTVEYYLNQTDAVAQKNQLPNLFTNTVPNQQIIYARIVNGSDCFGITPEKLVVNTFDPPNFQEETFPLCNGSNINLTVASGFSSYLWSNGSTTNTANISVPGEYTVTVTNTNGCKKTKKIIVKASGIGTITNATVTDFSGTENSVLISYSGDGDYEFSLDGNFYQDNPLFTGLNAGIYSATVRDKNGCGISVPYKVYILDYPRFFTPNNDSYNDTWKIKNLDILPKSTIAILDRYGKLLNQLGSNTIGWNGTYNGKELPADDYWFILTFDDGKIIKGHFSLKR